MTVFDAGVQLFPATTSQTSMSYKKSYSGVLLAAYCVPIYNHLLIMDDNVQSQT